MTRAILSSQHGQTLIEVLVAVAVTAVTVLGLIAVQLALARDARAMSYRAQAALVADALAEAARAPYPSEAAINQWKTRAASLLPKGDAGINGGRDSSGARVTWAWQASMPRDTANPGDTIDAPASCADVDAPRGMQCVAIAFSR
ncbi:prepilin-type N-terminal cleavage/methylation domain-containing protein [Paraburkholderia phymatum]|uniref:Type IV pilus modification protein PilV n=1 Tax=Paraburkholderia phymatum (strain DSM 17167 / CIP 108236 / LMG 21445 / STM815) TaxID=391038 RepID=B2JFZ4_PARP8|nr:prepilin-type N-terminal cleavage/methylation domain-containing protein [Paraburkholderia phymatum]ACC71619.1 conserved hypothetical protein [Paraburkholderia phymatum STM815]